MGTSTMSGHYVCHIKKEGRWVELGETHKDEQMFSLKHASVQSRMCIHGRQNMHVITIPSKEMKIVTDCRCDESVLIPLRSMLKHIISSPVVAVLNLCSLWGISSVSGFVYLSFPQLSFVPHHRNPSNYGLILVLLVLQCWSWLQFWYVPIIWPWESLIFLQLNCNYTFLCMSLFSSWLCQ